MGTHMTGGRLLHGGDYNPEQWLERPEILEEDIILMKEAGINCVTLGVFSWSMLEPEEGNYDFAWLAERIDRLYENGIQVILATPSGAMPHWLTQKYPEVMQVQEDEKRNLPGLRHNSHAHSRPHNDTAPQSHRGDRSTVSPCHGPVGSEFCQSHLALLP